MPTNARAAFNVMAPTEGKSVEDDGMALALHESR
jgi:hypothetical protein